MSVVDIVCFCVCRDLQTLVIFSFFRSGFTVHFKIMIRSPIETTGKDTSYASDSGDVNGLSSGGPLWSRQTSKLLLSTPFWTGICAHCCTSSPLLLSDWFIFILATFVVQDKKILTLIVNTITLTHNAWIIPHTYRRVGPLKYQTGCILIPKNVLKYKWSTSTSTLILNKQLLNKCP